MLILLLARAAGRPDWLQWWYSLFFGGWSADPTLGGFVEVDRRPRYYRDGAAAVVMRLGLGPRCG